MKRLISAMKDQAGAVAVTIAILMVVLVGFAALAIDIGYLLVTRNELQNVADAAALAATRKLGNNYQNMTFADQLDYECGTVEWGLPCSDIRDVAQEVGLANRAGQVDIVINPEDVLIGRWNFLIPPPFDPDNDPFTVTNAQPRAVRVIARRDETANNPISTFLAGVLDVDTLSVSAVATAALGGQGSADPGELELPVGIDELFFKNKTTEEFCKEEIYFSPTSLSCAGWTSWDAKNSNAKLMLDLVTGVEENPEADVGDVFHYGGGDIANLFDDLQWRFRDLGYDVDSEGGAVQRDPTTGERVTGALPTGTPGAIPMYELDENGTVILDDKDGDGVYEPIPLIYELAHPLDPKIARNEHVWPTTVVVYEDSGCENPNQTRRTVGFARIKITNVLVEPEKTLVGKVDCDYVSTEATRGGGGAFGSVGSVPGLVQ